MRLTKAAFSSEWESHPALNRVLRDDCMDAGGSAMCGTIAEKARMRGYDSTGTVC